MRAHTVTLKNGFRVGATELGAPSDPVLIFLHGVTASGPAYIDLLKWITKLGYRVIALDAPDHGRSDSLPWGHTIGDMATVVLEAIAVLLDRRDDPRHRVYVTLAGHSMGGAIAIEVAARRPDIVKACVLLDPAAGEPHHHAIRFERHPSMAVRGAQFAAHALLDAAGDGWLAVRKRSLTGALSLFGQLRRSLSGPDCLRAVYALMRHDTGPALATMRECGVPTVLLHGRRDQIVPFSAGMHAAQACRAVSFGVEDGYHSWMISDPKRAASMIGDGLYMIGLAA